MRNINRGIIGIDTGKFTTTQKSLLKKKVVEAKEKEENLNKSQMRLEEKINCPKHPVQLSKQYLGFFYRNFMQSWEY